MPTHVRCEKPCWAVLPPSRILNYTVNALMIERQLPLVLGRRCNLKDMGMICGRS